MNISEHAQKTAAHLTGHPIYIAALHYTKAIAIQNAINATSAPLRTRVTELEQQLAEATATIERLNKQINLPRVCDTDEINQLREQLAEALNERDRAISDKDAVSANYDRLRDQESVTITNLRNVADQLRADLAAVTKEREYADRLIIQLIERFGTIWGGDWACKECHPDSDMLTEGFRCAYHSAVARQAERKVIHVP